MEHIETLEPEALAGGHVHRHDRRDDSRSASGPGPHRERRPGRIDREHSDGIVHIVKRARGGDRSALRREAEVLRSIGHPMLVRLVELRDLADTTEMVMGDCSGPSLAALLADPETSPGVATAHLADTCEVVARLHALGWAHGRICTDHVLSATRGMKRLCSLSAAMPIDVDAGLARQDRIALLRMVDEWVVMSTRQPIRTAPWRHLVATRVARSTRKLSDDPDPLLLARILRRCGDLRRIGARTGLAAASIVLALLVIPMLLFGRTDPGAHGVARSNAAGARVDPGRPVHSTASSTRTDGPTTVPPTSAAPRPDPPPMSAATAVAGPDTSHPSGAAEPNACDSPASAPAVAIDLDGDGCGEPVTVSGSTVIVGSRRFRIGAPGDVVAVGDWDCDGRRTPAVLQLATGTVHVFEDWASERGPVAATDVGSVTDAVGFAAADEPCGPPKVLTADGSSEAVRVP